MHIHISVIDGIKTFLYVLIGAFFWHVISYMMADTTTGKAMSFIL